MNGAAPQPLKAILAAQGRKQTWLAARTGRSTTFINHVVNGRVPPPPAFRADVAAALGVPERELFHDRWPVVVS